jgi:hypothetical protein
MMDKAHTIRSENATWEGRRFHVDASDILLTPGMPIPRRIEIVSERTGASGFYELLGAVTCTGDVVRWNYAPARGCSNALRTLGAVVWND